ncbi:MAG: cysteine desulfurase [Eubacteriaceae bacterium]|nr:cysteine desulfurase [Eubacteriaceae bacterium]
MNIYLDNAATTKPDKEVIGILVQSMNESWGNASSLHTQGQTAARVLEEARDICAGAINCRPSEIVFTSGATESNNIAILGYARKNRHKGNHLITTNIEHHAALYAFEQLEKEGFEVTYLQADEDGLISIRSVKDAIRSDTILISVMHANNEIGTVNPIKEIGEIAHKKGIVFHTDAVQSFGKLPIDVKAMNIDMLSVSAHKFHGPKGVGFLYVKTKLPVDPISFGGGQERHIRSGTLNTPSIAAMAKAVEITVGGMEENVKRMTELRDMLIDEVTENIQGVRLNGSRNFRLCNNANFSFEGINDDELLYALDVEGIRISSGSACAAGSVETSHVISAIGSENNGASARFTLSKYTTKEEILYTVGTLKKVVARLRRK